MLTIRPATPADHDALWAILEPTIRAGETYTLAPDLPRAQSLAYWFAPTNQPFVAEQEGQILGTYFLRTNQQGNGSHVANCGYITHPQSTSRGIARAMCAHSLDLAKAQGYRAMQFNFVVSTNHRAVRLWQSLGFEIVGRLPAAFHHPTAGFIEALVMYRSL